MNCCQVKKERKKIHFTSICGFSWVLRDSTGKVLMHSRRSVSEIASLSEAQFQSILWDIDSMISHKVKKVIVASEALEMINAINRPQEWPSFQYYASEIKQRLTPIEDWRFEKENSSSNKGAFLIAYSVLQDNRFQSYVAKGFPFWLKSIFDSESEVTF